MPIAPVPTNFQPIQGIVGPVQFSTQWAPASPPTDSRSTINTTCGPYTGAEDLVMADAFSSATVAVKSLTVEGFSQTTGGLVDVPLTGSFNTSNGFAEMTTTTENLVINGPATGNCGPFGN